MLKKSSNNLLVLSPKMKTIARPNPFSVTLKLVVTLYSFCEDNELAMINTSWTMSWAYEKIESNVVSRRNAFD